MARSLKQKISAADLEWVFEVQGGKCYISGVPMNVSYNRGDPFAFSPMLIDNRKPFGRDNVALVILALQNSSRGYSPDTIRKCLFYDATCDDFVFVVHRVKRMTKKKGVCCAKQPTICKRCKSAAEKERRESDPRTFLASLVNKAKAVSKKRAFPPIESGFLACVVDKFVKQGGRCAITGTPLTTKSKRPNTMSLARIDQTRPYTRDNVHIIAVVLNTRHKLTLEQYKMIRTL